jgi:hypothetical protein
MHRERDILCFSREERGRYTEAVIKPMLFAVLSFALPIVTVFATAL